MSFGLAKEDKFEIIATLREELHKKTKLEVLCENSSVITQLEKVDFERFVISWHEDIVPEKVQYFILHSESGIVKFSARFEQTPSAGAEVGLSYLIPDLIFFAQQRQNQRFSFMKGYDFPVCQPKHEPTDFEITYKSGCLGERNAKANHSS